MTNDEIARFFNDTQAYIHGNPDLRDPQVEGWFRTRQHFRNSSEHAILQIPVGCGKTGLMALLPLASRADRWLPAFADDFFDLILVDEGHYDVARSWERVFERFPDAKVVSLTATPFRGDGREIAGERVYAYPFRTAMVRGYIKQITAVNVAPEEISFTYRGDARRHTLEEVLMECAALILRKAREELACLITESEEDNDA